MDQINSVNKYAQVLVSIPNLETRTFSYIIPDEIADIVQIGIPVLVPFGRQGEIPGYIVGFSDYVDENIKLKEIYEILDEKPIFDINYLKFLEWVSIYYCCPLPTVIETAIPVAFLSKSKRVVILKDENYDGSKNTIIQLLLKSRKLSLNYLKSKSKLPVSQFYKEVRSLVAKNIIEVVNEQTKRVSTPKTETFVKFKNNENTTKRQNEILELIKLNENELIKLSEVINLCKTTYLTIKKLAENGNIEIIEKEVYRNALKRFEGNISNFSELNSEQELAFEKIKNSLAKEESLPLLLYGITGSGKTEVYLHAMREVINEGKTVIFLVPEIALSSQLSKRIAERFGIERVAIWHSNIADGERYDIWNKIRDNEIDIIIGARSAIFAPLNNLGLIIIDEEHETSFKQTSPAPRYNAKDIAKYRTKQNKALLVLGSATPDIQTYYRALNQNRVLTLSERFGNAELAKVNIIDMKNEIKKGVFSRTLLSALENTFKQDKQAILLINRRGFATTTLCKSCGHIIECQKCSIPMIYHKSDNNLKCHYCNYELNIPENCPECGNPDIRNFGLGTQRVEEDFKKVFPDIACARIDSDIMSKKNAYIEIIEAFSRGEIQVLIGTQMIAKGLDMPNVILVGVISADNLFNMPDFKGVERGFQLLTQVAGRAGRGQHSGKVYFQTYTPDFYALIDAKEQNYIDFYNKEIEGRLSFSYPPYSQLTRLIISAENKYRAEKISNEIAFILTKYVKDKGIIEKMEVLGPSGCVISKIKEEYRYQIIIKNRIEEKGHKFLMSALKKLSLPKDIKFLIDVDPIDML